jgi:hypothetical protein
MPLLLPAVSDARIFSRLGIQTYGFTPMKLPPGFNFFKTIHAADERIPMDAVAFGADAIYELLNRYKGQEVKGGLEAGLRVKSRLDPFASSASCFDFRFNYLAWKRANLPFDGFYAWLWAVCFSDSLATF